MVSGRNVKGSKSYIKKHYFRGGGGNLMRGQSPKLHYSPIERPDEDKKKRPTGRET